MDKKKSDKLKEVLNQTLTTEDIQKKLKEEMKSSALRKQKAKIEEKKNKELKEEEEDKKVLEPTDNLIKNESLDEKIISSSIKKKKKDERGINILLYLVGIIAILLLAIVIYLFTNNNKQINNTPNQIVTEKNIEEKILTVVSEEIEKEENIVAEKKPLEEKAKEIIKIKEVVKEKIVTKFVKLDKKNFKEYYNSSKYNTLKCYNFKAGDTFPTSDCKTKLKKFLTVNKDAIRFEVIAVIAQDDNTIFKKMESNLQNLDEVFKNKVKEYMFRGLSRERVLESSWQIKDILGKDTILTPTNYYVMSKKNNKGIIIKAYH